MSALDSLPAEIADYAGSLDPGDPRVTALRALDLEGPGARAVLAAFAARGRKTPAAMDAVLDELVRAAAAEDVELLAD